jgi:hypothetical protein
MDSLDHERVVNERDEKTAKGKNTCISKAHKTSVKKKPNRFVLPEMIS